MSDLIERVNDRDNRRIWHTKVADTGKGFYLWVGNRSRKWNIWSEANKLWYDGGDRSETTSSLANAGLHFTKPYKTDYLMGENSDKPIHPFVYDCGEEWLGIARTPLPKDWYLPTSKWSGWTHLMHWQLGREGWRQIPMPSSVFEYVRHTLEEYPDTYKYSEELVDTCNLRSLQSNVLSGFFPWLNTSMRPED